MWNSLWTIPEHKEAKQQNGTLEAPFLKRVLILGNSYTGKSSLLCKLTDKKFEDNFIATIGVDFKMKNFIFPCPDNQDLKANGLSINVQFFDTAGQERFMSITKSYYRGASGVILVYDVTSLESFACIENWSRDIDNYCHQNNDEMVKVLVGNKCDLSGRQVSESMGRKLADKINALFIETSAKKNINVDDAFDLVAKNLLELAVEKRDQELQSTQNVNQNVNSLPNPISAVELANDPPPLFFSFWKCW